MKKVYFFINGLCLLILFAIFLWETISAILKYSEKKTIASTYFTDDGFILFPSITVCKKYLMGPNAIQLGNISMPIEAKVDRLHRNIWRRNEVFYFFSHPNMYNLSFPCTSVEGRGTTPGKPCSFPSIDLQGFKLTQCDGPDNFCFTRFV